MSQKVKILTLNCWGVFIPFASQHRNERIPAIASELSKGDYDIVILQEIWTMSDYDKLCTALLPVMPHSHYFHSGVFGSGVCLFSKHLIYETFHYRFPLNGFPQKLHQSDWYCGKSVGLAKILMGDIRLHVYGTHLHAEYGEVDDNEAHRAVQSYQMAQFIHNTSDGCDAVIVGGDFNYRPDQLGYRVILHRGNLQDAFTTQREKCESEKDMMTCNRPDNPYTNVSELRRFPLGTRLDYIMYRANAGVDIVCERCQLAMQGIPDSMCHYSDHEGLSADLVVRLNVTSHGKRCEPGDLEKTLSDLLPVVDNGLKKVQSSRVFYAVACLLCLVALFFTNGVDVPWGLSTLLTLMRVCLVLYLAFCVWMAVVMSHIEENCLTAARKDVNNTLRTLPDFK